MAPKPSRRLTPGSRFRSGAPDSVQLVRERLIRGLIGWLVLSAVGIVVVALPDEGERIISFSEGHGPSLVEALGVLMLVLGWLLFLVPLWRLRSSIRWRRRLGLVAMSAAVLTVWSVVTDTGGWCARSSRSRGSAGGSGGIGTEPYPPPDPLDALILRPRGWSSAWWQPGPGELSSVCRSRRVAGSGRFIPSERGESSGALPWLLRAGTAAARKELLPRGSARQDAVRQFQNSSDLR